MADDGPLRAASPASKLNIDSGLARVARMRAQMERTTSENIREEGKELQQAAEQSFNIILDLTLDCHIRWVSPTWTEVVGTEVEEIQGKLFADLLVENRDVFSDAVTQLRTRETSSKFVRFSVMMGPKSRWRKKPLDKSEEEESGLDTHQEENYKSQVVDLEAQGIMVYERATGEESHVSLQLPGSMRLI